MVYAALARNANRIVARSTFGKLFSTTAQQAGALARFAGSWHKPGVIPTVIQAVRLRWGFVLVGLLSCQPEPARAPTAHTSGEIDLTEPAAREPEPEPAPSHRLRPCREGQLESCSLEDPADANVELAERPSLDPTKRYSVEVNEEDPMLGPSDAPVRLVVFSDYQCPHCRVLHDILGELRARYPQQVQFVWKDLPLPMHAYAEPAALLGREAFLRGGNAAFWRINHELYARQSAFSDSVLAALARDFALSWPPSPDGKPKLDRSLRQVRALNVVSTPTTFVNGRPLVGVKHLKVFTTMIDDELLQARNAERSR